MKPQTPPRFCASAMTCSASVVLPADAERNIEPERARRDRLDLDHLLGLAEAHDRALAEGPFDLAQRRVERLCLVHSTTLDEAERVLRHVSAPYSIQRGRLATFSPVYTFCSRGARGRCGLRRPERIFPQLIRPCAGRGGRSRRKR